MRGCRGGQSARRGSALPCRSSIRRAGREFKTPGNLKPVRHRNSPTVLMYTKLCNALLQLEFTPGRKGHRTRDSLSGSSGSPPAHIPPGGMSRWHTSRLLGFRFHTTPGADGPAAHSLLARRAVLPLDIAETTCTACPNSSRICKNQIAQQYVCLEG